MSFTYITKKYSNTSICGTPKRSSYCNASYRIRWYKMDDMWSTQSVVQEANQKNYVLYTYTSCFSILKKNKRHGSFETIYHTCLGITDVFCKTTPWCFDQIRFELGDHLTLWIQHRHTLLFPQQIYINIYIFKLQKVFNKKSKVYLQYSTGAK